MSAREEKPEAEETDAGSQTLMRGVAPITLRDRLLSLAAAPLAPCAAQKSCDVGLFDLESRRQIDLVDELRRLDREAASQSKPSATGE
ncbi:hypothetical protein [Hyphococcus sp.]|uniref:hypothetical protein n=1 Tax=Hyphococcus sp. TaxID=2038636 RepID=UPI00208A631C|nr:MAG: hypothetical protein DHS20C04_22650 [Marinicaulis sp.]